MGEEAGGARDAIGGRMLRVTDGSVERNIADYYDQESPERSGWDRDDIMVARRDAFIATLHAEGRLRLLEIGCGTGADLSPFSEAGFAIAVGIDLSRESARIARSRGGEAMCASLFALPFATSALDGIWTMSTLMHVPDERWDAMAQELMRVTTAGSPIAIGVWGSGGDIDANGVKHHDRYLPKRTFYRRSDENLQRRLQVVGTIEHFDTTRYGPDTYQYAVVRTRPAPTTRPDTR